jgi:hypothetical protein
MLVVVAFLRKYEINRMIIYDVICSISSMQRLRIVQAIKMLTS